MRNKRINRRNEVSLDTVITDVDQEGPALQQFVEQHRKILSPSKSLRFVKEAQAYLRMMYVKNNAQSDSEKMKIIQSLPLETPLKLGYTTDLMEKESNIALDIYEVAYVQQKAKEIADTRSYK